MRKSLLFGLLLLSFLLSTQIIVAQDQGLLTTFAQSARIRTGPGTDWRLLGAVDAGTPIRLDGQAPGGGWVRGILPDSRVVWVVNSALVAPADQLTALPKVWIDDPFTLSAPAGGAPAPAANSAAPTAVPAQAADSTQAAAPASTAGLANGLEVKTGSSIRLRDNPEGTPIGNVNSGATVVVDGRNAEQSWVRGTVPGGAKGWMAARYLVITAEQVAGLPVVQGGASTAPAAAANSGATSANAAIVPVVSSAPVRGFSYGGHVASLGERTVSAMQLAGMSWVKRQVRYQAGQNAGDVAGLINEAHGMGFRILLGIVGSPGQVNDGGYFEQYASFVAGAAALGADAIEIWNEPNIDREWPGGQIDPARYTQLLRQSYQAIKGVNPNTLVISGAPAPTGYFDGCSAAGCDDNAFIAGMAAAGAASVMDCVGLHYNEGVVSPDATSGDPRGSSGYYTRYFWGMVNTYSGAFGGARPLCFTEFGYLTPEGFPPLPGAFGWAENVSVAQQATWLDRAVALSGSSGRVRLLIVWNVDFTDYGADPMAGYAIIRPDGSCPACELLGH
jgi:uncharacterized protein YraI